MPEWLVLALATAVVCGVVLGVIVLHRRRAGADDDTGATPDVLEYMIMMIGVVYAIVLGLAIAGVWEAHNEAEDHVRTEAQALHEIHERVRVYPPAVRDRIRADVDAYVGQVVGDEWRAMARDGELTARGERLLERVRHDVTDYRPADDFTAQAYQPLVDQVAAADDARNARADSSGATMPGIVWFGLVIGAVVTIGLIFVLQIRRTGRELLLAVVFSALIAFSLFLIWDLDTPYARGLATTASPFRLLFPGAG